MKELDNPFVEGLYDKVLETKLQNLNVLYTTFSSYLKTPAAQRGELRKKASVLFHIYWRSALRLFLEDLDGEGLSPSHLFMRYGLLSLNHLSPANLKSLGEVTLKNRTSCDIFYLDEWLREIGYGRYEVSFRERRSKNPSLKVKDRNKMSLSLVSEELLHLEDAASHVLQTGGISSSPLLHEEELEGALKLRIVTREFVQRLFELVNAIDPGLFLRSFSKATVEKKPIVILIPSYAYYGVCWEAFNRFERETSQGRLLIPLYPANPRMAVLAALASLRWKTAKQVAGAYWLEKGLTGCFYDLYRKLDVKGNEEKAFIQAYCTWILEESQGRMKLPEEIRTLFWKMIPFPEARREALVKGFAQFRVLAEEI